MANFRWNAGEIKVSVAGIGNFSVYPKFGCPKTRFVQGLASRVGGMLWITVKDDDFSSSFPVPNPFLSDLAGHGTEEGRVQMAGDIVGDAYDQDYEIFVSRRGGEEHKVTFEFSDDAADNENYSNDNPPEQGGIRSEF